MSSVSALFNKPQLRPIGDLHLPVYKLELRQFDDALTFGGWLKEFEAVDISAETLEALRSNQPVRLALEQLVAGSLGVPIDSGLSMVDDARLSIEDAQAMPIMTFAEAVAHVMEVNLDFFIQTLPALKEVAGKLGSIGSALLSASSALATGASASSGTPSPRS